MSRAGHTPPLPRDGFLSPRRGNGQPSQISPSSVTCGDSFPQKGEAFRGVHPVGCLVGRIARAAYMPPLQTNPQVFHFHSVAGGACPAPTARWFLSPRRGNGQPSHISPSSVTCGDSFPQKGEAFRGVHPVGCLVGRIARAAYMPPLQTNPQVFHFHSVAGGACPVPTARWFFIAP